MNYNGKKMKGFTIVEMMIVVGVAALAGTLYLAASKSFFDGPKYQELIRQHTQIVNKLEETFKSRPFFDATVSANTLDTEMVLDLEIVPSEKARTVSGNTVIATQFSASYLEVEAVGAAQPNRVTLDYTGLPSEACIKFLEPLEDRALSIVITPTGGSATTVKTAGGALGIGAMSTACKAADTLDIAFVYQN